LKPDGFEAWLDKESIFAGQNWELEINKALRTCDVVVFFIPTISEQSRVCAEKDTICP
jgi:TIR domain